MPKGGGKGGSSKRTAKQPNHTEDGGNTIFEDDRSKKKNNNGSKETSANAKQNAAEASGQEAPKRPDNRQIIGGASWTGKLPVNLLSEHCQKQKWSKPEYTMTKAADGFLSSVILKSVDPKTRETITLPPFVLPPSYRNVAIQPTAIEARHFAATYALFRVCSMRNIHMMLPQTYRDFWKNEFGKSKKEDIEADRGWMYAADPFVAQQEQNKAHALSVRRKAEQEKRSGEAKQPINISFGSNVNGSEPNSKLARSWIKAPTIEMGKQTRGRIESLVQQKGVWNPHGIKFPESQVHDVTKQFASLGFRESHVEEAITECKDREEALEWLLIHVPEDDLPRWSLPEGYTAGISMASGNLKRDATIARLAEAGYSTDLCGKTLHVCDGDEGRAAEALQKTLAPSLESDTSAENVDEIDISAVYVEEQDTLSAIFGERFKSVSESVSEIELQTQYLKTCTLRIRRSPTYPKVLPIMAVVARDLPAYIRLSILRQLLEHAQSNLMGQPMIFNLVDWLENEIPRIVENPGKLRDVSGAVTGTSQSHSPLASRCIYPRTRARSIHWKSGTPKDIEIQDDWFRRQNTPRQQKLLAFRQNLPAWKQRETIIQAVNQNQVTIISGETGSGKSTQIVQFILDDLIQRQLGSSANMICTQPRRISALGLADRVSDERCTTVGDEVGYAIRGESNIRPGQTKITFVTTGVLLRRLQTASGRSENVLTALADVSHVIIDEVTREV